MKAKFFLFAVVCSLAVPKLVFSQGSVFTYQGRLSDHGAAANGVYDFQFSLWNSLDSGSQIGTPSSAPSTLVSNGLFTVFLDFGSIAFNGNARWLQVGVRTNGSPGDYTLLTPRQPFTATPYAIMAGNVPDGSISSAKLAAGSVTANKIATGAINNTQLAFGTAALNLRQAGQSAVASGGIILAEEAQSEDLAEAGYVRIGSADIIRERWELRSSTAPASRAYHAAVWTGNEMIVWGGIGDWPYSALLDDGAMFNPAANNWVSISSLNAPSPRKSFSAVWTGTDLIIWGGSSGSVNSMLGNGSLFNPANNAWTTINTDGGPASRYGHTAVWTGTEMIIWGASTSPNYNTGGRYFPATNGWRSISTANAPSSRSHTAVWTGTKMIVWGGDLVVANGGIYDPISDSWTNMDFVTAPQMRANHTAVWTGNEMLVWGGNNFANDLNDGGRYDPVSNKWSAIQLSGAPSPRSYHTAVWTGSEMIIWGGGNPPFLSDGARYNPATNGWTPCAAIGTPSARAGHTAVWTGDEMLIWGGMSDVTNHTVNSGSRYSPTADTWTPTASGGISDGRAAHTAIWTGSEMLIWGGSTAASIWTREGARYNPATDVWLAMSSVGAPMGRYGHTAVWSSSEMLVWGGITAPGQNLADGGRYDPVLNTWLPITLNQGPSAREFHTAVWTGTEMLIWGGQFSGPFPTIYFADGARYTPQSDSWTPLNAIGAPGPRANQTAVWTATEMIIWGGQTNSSTFYNNGARYNPSSDTWTTLATSNAPAGRYSHSAVWTGREMIVWGGQKGGSASFNSGGRYDPDADTWSPVTLSGAPSARYDHTAVWTGHEMIVWGGPTANSNLGGRYNPVANTWTATTLTGVPSSRYGHTAVWTGSEMLISGGVTLNGSSPETYRYIPPRTLFVYLRP